MNITNIVYSKTREADIAEKFDVSMSTTAAAMLRSTHHLARLESAKNADSRRHTETEDGEDGFQTNLPTLGPMLRPSMRLDHQLGSEFDYEGAARASYFGRRTYPTFDPSSLQACPLRFIRQFEHAAQHNGLHPKAWAKRLDSCLHGRSEDWAFDECPLEASSGSWEVRKKQFLDWALLPAEQELRRQRLLRFYQMESDLSIDFVYSFEEAARGLRDYKEDVWVRKCIANMVSPIRTALFELWPDGLPVRFRDLRDSLYAVDWNLYEAASVPLKVVKYGKPYVYETYASASAAAGQSAGPTPPASRVSTSSGERPLQTSRPSMSISVNRVHSPPATSPAVVSAKKKRPGFANTAMGTQNRSTPNSASSGALSPRVSSESATNRAAATEVARAPSAAGLNTGLYELVNTLSRISEKERSVIMVALEKMAGAATGDVLGAAARREAESAGMVGPEQPISSAAEMPSRNRPMTRAAAAAAIAATAQMACGGGLSTEGAASDSTDGSGNDTQQHKPSARIAPPSSATPLARISNDSTSSANSAGKIRLRTRPLTSMACSSRRLSSPLIDSRLPLDEPPINSANTSTPLFPGDPADGPQLSQRGTRQTHARKLSSRKSDSALTTATRSMHAAHLQYRDSADNALRSPEFTVLHPAIDMRPPHTRRGRFAFIKKLSHMLTQH